MEKINIAEILRHCPKGMELDCAMFDNVTFVGVDTQREFPIEIKVDCNTIYLTKEGCYHRLDYRPSAKCVIFPKGKTTWKGFQRPFKDGDVVVCKENEKITQMFILKSQTEEKRGYCYTGYDFRINEFFEAGKWYFDRLATEKEKQKLFDAIKANGYKWNTETKILEKLIEPKFKNMKKNYTVKDLISYLLDFNMEAEVLVNASGVPEGFDISWSDGKDSSDPSIINSKKRADTVCFNVICGEK